MRIGDRVKLPKHSGLSDGTVTKVHYSKWSSKPCQVTVELDEYSPDCKFGTNEVLVFICDVEVINGE